MEMLTLIWITPSDYNKILPGVIKIRIVQVLLFY